MSEWTVTDEDIDELRTGVMPRHVALIMDGNGRWASGRGLPRIEGHRQAVAAVRDVVRTAGRIGISYLTLYTFSSENWGRPPIEVNALMGLLADRLVAELPELNNSGVRLVAIGRIDGLPGSAQSNLRHSIASTENNRGLTLVLALNYGGRSEIVDAVRRLTGQIAGGELDLGEISEEAVAACLYRPDVPDPDLIIRSGGEQRLSNFLLWQSAYAELYFTPVLWPDFRGRDLVNAIREFRGRQRRYGGLPDKEEAQC